MSRSTQARALDLTEDRAFGNDLDRYIPLDQQRAALFLSDWEGLVLSCLQRLRVDDLEGVLSRVFEKALYGLPHFRGESKMSTWLYRIAWREGLRSLASSGRIQKKEILSEDISLEADPDDSAEQILLRMETASNVRRAIDALGPIDREVLALRYLEELKLDEIAERLEIPLGTVKVRVHRGLARLRKNLEKDNGE